MIENSNNDLLDSNQQPQALPNATTALVLGILSMVLCGPGLILGIVGVVLANKDIGLYKNNPGYYSEASYSNLRTGRICSIIGIILTGLILLLYIGFFAIVFFTATQSMS